MNETTNAQLIAIIASHFQGYLNLAELVKQLNLSPLMKKEFDAILCMLKERLTDVAPVGDKA